MNGPLRKLLISKGIALRCAIVWLLACAGCSNRLEVEDMVPFPIGKTFKEIEQAHLPRPEHQFTVAFEDGNVRCAAYEIDQKGGGAFKVLLLFKNDRLLKVCKAIPEQMSYGGSGDQLDLLHYKDLMRGARRVFNAPALTEPQLREIVEGGYGGDNWMAPWRIPAVVIEAALLPVHLPFRLLIAAHDKSLRDQYDPFQIRLGETAAAVDETLGRLQSKGMDLNHREFHLFAPQDKLWGSGVIRPVVVWFKDGKAVAVGSGWFASGQPPRHGYHQSRPAATRPKQHTGNEHDHD